MLGIRTRSRVSSISRFDSASLLRLVSVIAPFHGQLRPDMIEQGAALLGLISKREKLAFSYFSVAVHVEVKGYGFRAHCPAGKAPPRGPLPRAAGFRRAIFEPKPLRMFQQPSGLKYRARPLEQAAPVKRC